jgi:hypothetical protein
VLGRLEGLEVARPAAYESVPVVAAHVVQQGGVVTRKGADCVAIEQFGVEIVRLAGVAVVTAGLDAFTVDGDDAHDDLEVEEGEGTFRSLVRVLLGIAHVDRLGGLFRIEGSRVLVGDVRGRADLGSHSPASSASRHGCLSQCERVFFLIHTR